MAALQKQTELNLVSLWSHHKHKKTPTSCLIGVRFANITLTAVVGFLDFLGFFLFFHGFFGFLLAFFLAVLTLTHNVLLDGVTMMWERKNPSLLPDWGFGLVVGWNPAPNLSNSATYSRFELLRKVAESSP